MEQAVFKDQSPSRDDIDEELFQSALYLSTAVVTVPAAIMAANDLDVLQIIAKAGPGAHLSPTEIVSHLPTRNPNAAAALHRILRVLASHSILECSSRCEGEAKYGLRPVCKFFLNDKDGVSLNAMPSFVQSRVFIDSWQYMKDAVLEGVVPFEKAYGMPFYQFQAVNTKFKETFAKAMAAHSTLVVKKMLDTYNGFEGLTELMDVAGGTGSTLNLIVSKYPQIKGTNFDLKHVIEAAPNYPGVKHLSGDMFDSIPSAKNIIMKWILHNWSDEHCVKLLKNCYTSLPEFGKLIVVDSIVGEDVDAGLTTTNVFGCDFTMLTFFPNAKERTREEFQDLAKASGFSTFKPICCAYGVWVMEFHK
uniref:KOMT1 n=1 Tax=Piper methysticum TaxID=130404 RepID=A0A4Y5QNK8_9MAGN|nr:KOMT1 [Piper methysticum]